MTQTQYTTRQLDDARMDLQIAVEHYVDASINVQQERYDESHDTYASSERRLAHATRVLGTTIDEFDDLFFAALHARIRAYPAVAAMFPHHAHNEVDSCSACQQQRTKEPAMDTQAHITQQLAQLAREKDRDILRGNIRRLEHAFGRADDQGCHEEAQNILDQINVLDAQLADALKEIPLPAYQYHPSHDATVTADDLRPLSEPADRNADNAEAAAEDHEDDCTCQQCNDTRELDHDHAITWMRANNEHGNWTADIARQQRWQSREQDISVPDLSEIPFLEVGITPAPDTRNALCGEYEHALTHQHATIREAWTDESRLLFCRWDGPCVSHPVAAVADMLHTSWTRVTPAWNARLAARAASVVTAAGGLALALSCLTGTPASAHTYPRQYPAFDTLPASCEMVKEDHDDGSLLAYCPLTGETYLYDADGQPYQNAAGVPVRDPGWYVAPELLQIGPNAPADAR